MSDILEFSATYICPVLMIACAILIVLAFIAGIHQSINGCEEEKEQGRRAALNGLPPQSCPYGDAQYGATMEKEAWMRGWQQGAMELRNGGKTDEPS